MNDLEYIDHHITFLETEIEASNGGYRKMLMKSLNFFTKYRNNPDKRGTIHTTNKNLNRNFNKNLNNNYNNGCENL